MTFFNPDRARRSYRFGRNEDWRGRPRRDRLYLHRQSDQDRIEGHAVGTVPPINALKKVDHRLNRYQPAAAKKMEAAKVKAGIPKGAPFPKGFKVKKSNRLKHALGKVASLQAKVARVRPVWSEGPNEKECLTPCRCVKPSVRCPRNRGGCR